MDALLPTDRRYTSLKFRRVARKFWASRLDYDDAAELVAFVVTVGGVARAKYIFHWTEWTEGQAKLLVGALGSDPRVLAMIAENEASVTRDIGLKCLSAMRDGGWRKGAVPPCVRLAVLDMRDTGMSEAKAAAALGLTREQVRIITNGTRPRYRPVPLTGLVAA